MSKDQSTTYHVRPKHDGKLRAIRCRVCDFDKFYTRRSMLNTRGMTLLGLDWANAEADNLVCASCGHLEWFLAT